MLTEEEKRQLFLAKLRGDQPAPQMSPVMQGTTGPYMADSALMEQATKDFGGQEGTIANQRAMAKQMMGREGPQGRTVGPYGLYMGPNIGDVLSSAASKLGGGLLAREAAKDAKELEGERAESALAKSTLAANRQQFEDAKEKQRYLEEVAREEAREAEAKRRFEAQQTQERDRWEAEERNRIAKEERSEELRQAKTNASVLTEIGDEIKDEADSKRERADKLIDASQKRVREAEEAKAEGDSKTEVEAKNTFRAGMLREAIDDMVQLRDAGYNPSGIGAFKDKYMATNDVTRGLSSDEGLMFKSAANTGKEQVLRAATGAAAPTSENEEYIETLVPRIGEGRDVFDYKIGKLEEAYRLLNELAGEEGQLEGDQWNEVVNTIREEDDQYQGDEFESRRARREARKRGPQNVPAEPTQYNDPEKERRYQEWLRRQQGG